jgi:hypothetical protein
MEFDRIDWKMDSFAEQGELQRQDPGGSLKHTLRVRRLVSPYPYSQ